MPVLAEWMSTLKIDTPVRFKRYPVLVPSAKIKGVEGYFCIARESPGRMVFEFDISAPIGPQIERAKVTLKENQKLYSGPKRMGGKSRASLYPIYLRVLDALADSATSKNMLGVFSAENDEINESSIRNWKRAATALRDGGYKKLVVN